MSFLQESLYFGFVISLAAYLAGVWIKKKVGWAILNPLLVSVVIVIAVLKLLHVDYASYNNSAKYISYLLTPSTVCLAIPLYKQLELLKKNFLSGDRGHYLGCGNQRRQHFSPVYAVWRRTHPLCFLPSEVHYHGNRHGCK